MHYAVKKGLLMKFSIITICYNEEKHIENTLKSIYMQSYTDYEHIIEDGCSTDNTLQIVKNCEKFYKSDALKVFSQKDEGLYDAMNIALTRASGEYICFINSGDYLLDEKTLQKVSEQIDSNPEMDVYYGDAIVTFPNGDEIFQTMSLPEEKYDCNMKEILSTARLGLIHQAIFANRKCFQKIRFDTKYTLRAELDWYYQSIIAGYRFKKINFPVCKYAFGGLSERAMSVEKSITETKDIIKKYGFDVEKYEASLMEGWTSLKAYNNIYNKWLALKLAGYSIEKYLLAKSVKKIVVYGYGELGNHLLRELRGTSVEVTYVMERLDRYPYSDIPLIKPDRIEALQKVDMLIITAIMHFEEIKKIFVGKVSCEIVSLEEILEEMWDFS